jgi:hypothetical protein
VGPRSPPRPLRTSPSSKRTPLLPPGPLPTLARRRLPRPPCPEPRGRQRAGERSGMGLGGGGNGAGDEGSGSGSLEPRFPRAVPKDSGGPRPGEAVTEGHPLPGRQRRWLQVSAARFPRGSAQPGCQAQTDRPTDRQTARAWAHPRTRALSPGRRRKPAAPPPTPSALGGPPLPTPLGTREREVAPTRHRGREQSGHTGPGGLGALPARDARRGGGPRVPGGGAVPRSGDPRPGLHRPGEWGTCCAGIQ